MIALLLALAMPASQPPLVVDVREADGRCMVAIDGRTADVKDAAALDRLLAGQDPKLRRIDVSMGAETSYRCVGGVVYTLQMRGFDFVDKSASPGAKPLTPGAK